MCDLVPDGWNELQLEDISSLITKGTTPKKYSSEGVNFVKVESVSNSATLIPSKFAYIDTATHEGLRRSQLEAGDILFSIAGSLGRLAVISSQHLPANTNQALAIIRLKKESIDIDFCIQQLKGEAVQSELENLQTVGAQPNLSLRQISNIKLNTPSLPEQQKIAAILTSVDEVIEKTQAQIDKLKDLKTGMMQQLLTSGVGVDGKPHTEFKDSAVGRIPKGWEVTTIVKSTQIRNTLRKPINKTERDGMKGIYPYYGPTKAVDFINEFKVEGEHMLIGEDGDHFIKFATWEMTQLVSGKFNVNNHAHIVKGTDCCRTKWLYYYFMHRDITASLTRQGASRYKLNKATLEGLVFVLPTIEEQDKIISILNALMNKIVQKEKKILKIRDSKKALMQDLLTGKVRVTVPESSTGH